MSYSPYAARNHARKLAQQRDEQPNLTKQQPRQANGRASSPADNKSN